MDEEVKLALVIRRDLKLRRGKEIGQGFHAGLAWLRDMHARGVTNLFDEEQRKFMFGLPIVIVFQTPDEASLMALVEKCNELGLRNHLIRDAGKTEVEPGTATALGIGPHFQTKLAKVTADLKLY